VFKLGLVGINPKKGLEGTQEPDMKVRCKPMVVKVLRNMLVNAGVISRSPLEPREISDSGLSKDDSSKVLAKVRSRFGRVAFWSTDRL